MVLRLPLSRLLPSLTLYTVCKIQYGRDGQFSSPTVSEFLVQLSSCLVNQVVSWDYINVQRNFVRVMEMNSEFTRDNLYVICLDEESASYLEVEMGIRCVPLGPMHERTRSFVWKLRVKVLSCLVEEGRFLMCLYRAIKPIFRI